MTTKNPTPEDKFESAWAEHGIQDHPPKRQHRFCPGRRFKFDFAWPDEKVAVEIDGFGFGHQSIKGRIADNEKQNIASLMGWTVLRFCTAQISSGDKITDAIHFVNRVLLKKWGYKTNA